MSLSPKQIATKALFPLLREMISNAKNNVEKHVTGRGNKMIKAEKAREQVDKLCAGFMVKMNHLNKASQSVADQIDNADESDKGDF